MYTVYYRGGSGGFLFFYSLQLALGNDVSELIESQWDIDDYVNWKAHETIDNRGREFLNGVNLSCNARQVEETDGISILLYTDIFTQEALSDLKKVYWYMSNRPANDDPTVEDWLNDFNTFYNDVKDDSWPLINTSEDVDNLPANIREELLNVFDVADYYFNFKDWFKHTVFESAIDYNGLKVEYKLQKTGMLDNVDYIFLLQDVIDTKFKCVTDKLGLEHTPAIAKHIDDWVALHPPHIQKMLHNE